LETRESLRKATLLTTFSAAAISVVLLLNFTLNSPAFYYSIFIAYNHLSTLMGIALVALLGWKKRMISFAATRGLSEL
jgi:hypothetical protein